MESLRNQVVRMENELMELKKGQKVSHSMLERMELVICGDEKSGMKSLHGRMADLEDTDDAHAERINTLENNQVKIGVAGAGAGSLFGGALMWLVDHWPFNK